MRLPTALILSSALALLGNGCATNSPGAPTSGSEKSSAGGGSSSPATPAPASTPQSTPAPAPSPSSSSTASGSAQPQSSASSAATRTASGDNAGTASGDSAQTPDERTAAIDRRLNNSLGTFDEQLKKEQERVAQERDAREAAAAGAAQTDSEATKEGEGEPGTADTENAPAAGTEGKTGDKTARPGDLKSDKDRGGANSGASSGTGATARDIPDGSDDDIVARRLRKAAEQETDPELKDKLWKEYIEYKKNAGK